MGINFPSRFIYIRNLLLKFSWSAFDCVHASEDLPVVTLPLHPGRIRCQSVELSGMLRFVDLHAVRREFCCVNQSGPVQIGKRMIKGQLWNHDVA